MMKTWKRTLYLLPLILAIPAAAAGLAQTIEDPNVVYDTKLYQGLHYRLIGPFRGGRVTAVAGIPDQPLVFYMGATGGGVWKTEDGGITWKNVSDGFFKVGSIGAVSVADSDPNVVYVGSGSACPRGNISPGDGMYKSDDAGKTWRHIGLPKAGLIARLAIHPKDPDLVYAAVLGNVFGPNPERGVYRTRDGGKNWEKVLFASDKTGAVDLVMDPTNPRVLYAAMWRVERKPWTLIDGSEDGGIFKTSDGGDHWKRLEGGLPDGVVGRAGIALSPANPDRVWVIQESVDEKKGGIFRSDDAGETWSRINREHNLRGRAWYYNHIYADPSDENTIYVANAGFFKSIDAGKSFSRIAVPHGDNHGLWINPKDPNILINCNDGGANVSYNGGRSWSSQLNQPTAEFYRVTVDNQFPYRVYGAQQDNTTISVPSRTPGGITPKEHWYAVGGGESGHIAVDPRNPNIIYAGNYIGQITRLDRERGHSRNITAYPQLHDGLAAREIRYRFQWNAPIRISPHDPTILYHTSQFVHRSRDEGQSWEVISPDLTTNNSKYQDLPGGPVQHDHTGVEMYTTIFAFEESPHTAGLLWAGTDDGLVHISRDHGGNWEAITPAEMPSEGTVNMIELSAHDAGRAFIAVYRYRRNDFRPYIFRTNDFGQTWDSLTSGSNGIPDDHFVRVVREDPDHRGLLYAGTEFGMYVSFDDGRHWQSLQLNLPVTPITDLAVHQQDLVVATQGRSFWILDDVTPLHQINSAVADSRIHLFTPRAAYRTQIRGFRAPNAPPRPPTGAMIRFYLAQEAKEDRILLEILDEDNQVIRSFSTKPDKEKREGQLKAEAGLNRFAWDLTYPRPEIIPGSVLGLSSTGGPAAPTGTYRVRLSLGDDSQVKSFRILKDPRWQCTDSDLRDQFELALAVRDKLSETHEAIRKIRSVREQATKMAELAKAAGDGQQIKSSLETLSEKLGALEKELIQTMSEGGQDSINYPPRLDNQIAYLYTIVNNQDARPTAGCYELFEDLKEQLKPRMDRLSNILEQDLEAFNDLLRREGIPHVIVR